MRLPLLKRGQENDHLQLLNWETTDAAVFQRQYYLLLAIMLVVLLAIAGLAVDSGNLFRAQMALQNASDATSIATVNYITMRGKLNFCEN